MENKTEESAVKSIDRMENMVVLFCTYIRGKASPNMCIYVYMICAILYTIKTIPPEGNCNKNKTKSPPTAHLHSHKKRFLREFFGKIKIILERGGKEDD